MKIELCFGSSCHVKGAKSVYALLEEALKRDGLSDKVELCGTLCLGECKANGCNMKIDGEIVTGVRADDFESFYNEKVKTPLVG